MLIPTTTQRRGWQSSRRTWVTAAPSGALRANRKPKVLGCAQASCQRMVSARWMPAHKQYTTGKYRERPCILQPRRPLFGDESCVARVTRAGQRPRCSTACSSSVSHPGRTSGTARSSAKLRPSSPNANRSIRASPRLKRSLVTCEASMGTRRTWWP